MAIVLNVPSNYVHINVNLYHSSNLSRISQKGDPIAICFLLLLAIFLKNNLIQFNSFK
jgi:hypothetical protein